MLLLVAWIGATAWWSIAAGPELGRVQQERGLRGVSRARCRPRRGRRSSCGAPGSRSPRGRHRDRPRVGSRGQVRALARSPGRPGRPAARARGVLERACAARGHRARARALARRLARSPGAGAGSRWAARLRRDALAAAHPLTRRRRDRRGGRVPLAGPLERTPCRGRAPAPRVGGTRRARRRLGLHAAGTRRGRRRARRSRRGRRRARRSRAGRRRGRHRFRGSRIAARSWRRPQEESRTLAPRRRGSLRRRTACRSRRRGRQRRLVGRLLRGARERPEPPRLARPEQPLVLVERSRGRLCRECAGGHRLGHVRDRAQALSLRCAERRPAPQRAAATARRRRSRRARFLHRARARGRRDVRCGAETARRRGAGCRGSARRGAGRVSPARPRGLQLGLPRRDGSRDGRARRPCKCRTGARHPPGKAGSRSRRGAVRRRRCSRRSLCRGSQR